MLLATFLLPSILPLAAAEKIYWEENFRNYADTAPGVVSKKGFWLGNDPIWSISAELNVCPKDWSGTIYAKDIALPALKNASFSCRLRFLNSKDPVRARPEVRDAKRNLKRKAVLGKPGEAKAFELILNGKTAVRISNDTISVNGRTGKYPFIISWTWEKVAFQLNNGKLAFFISRDRKFHPVLETPFSEPLNSINIRALKGNNFSVSDLMLSDLRPLKTYPVQKHFADFRSLSQQFKGSLAPVTLFPDSTGYAGARIAVGKCLEKSETPLMMILHWNNGKETTYKIRAVAAAAGAALPILGKGKDERIELPDAAISIEPGIFLWVRPFLKMFRASYGAAEVQYIDIVREWNNLPPASQHPLDMDFIRHTDGSVEWYLDGSLANVIRPPQSVAKDAKKIANSKEQETNAATIPPAKLEKIEFKNNGFARILVKKENMERDGGKYTILDLSANPRAKAFIDAKLSLKEGFQTINGIPLRVAAPIDSADVAICKQGKGNWALEVDEYHGRSPLAGFPSAIHFRLPAAPYSKAYILCALDPDPAKDKILTVRLGHYVYNGSGGNMLADTLLDLRDGKIPENFKKVGEVTLKGKTLPLYFVEVPLAIGKILDIAARGKYIDFEFTGKRGENLEQLNRTIKPDPNSDSAFNIFGVTLEKAPAVMDIVQNSPGNVFTEDEKAQTSVSLKALRPGTKGSVQWIARDTDGKEVFNGSKAFSLAKTGDTTPVEIPLKAPIGFYELDIRLLDGKRELLCHPARFAILPKDRRRTPKEKSPYATWWFNAHGSPSDIKVGGPLLQKAGIRKVSWVFPSPENMKKYNITNAGNLWCTPSFNYKTGHFPTAKVNIPDPKKPGKSITKELSGEEWFVDSIKKQMKPGGFYDHILIWHESAPGGGIPEELLNRPVNQTLVEKDKYLAAYINEAGPLIRKHFPHLKIQIGNSSASIGAATRPLRAGAKPEYYDFIGIETASQVICPEKLQEVGLQGMQISRDIANKLAKGKKVVKLNGTFEFTYR